MTTSRAQAGTRRPYAPRLPLAERREQLMDAALVVLVRDGYSAVSIEAIAREAGVTRPVVYGAFKDLRSLLLSLLDRQQARALGQLAGVLDGETDVADPVGVASAAAGRLIEAVRADPMTWQPILLAPSDMPHEVRSRIDNDRDLVVAAVARYLQAGLKPRAGSRLDVEVVAHVVLATMEHFGRILLSDPERFSTDRLVDSVGDLVSSLWKAVQD